ncbi:hypothetical protein ACQUY5_33085, partial [Bacillus cereus]|uniref:hypothetical protein n=1 Tax=Bacillus cereus TaxID=1396 RepID=UPI003D178A34
SYRDRERGSYMNENFKIAITLLITLIVAHTLCYWIIGKLHILSMIISIIGGVVGFWIIVRLEGEM